MSALVDFLNSIIWGYVLLYGLLEVHLTQRKAGDVPRFKPKDYPELHENIDSNIWH